VTAERKMSKSEIIQSFYTPSAIGLSNNIAISKVIMKFKKLIIITIYTFYVKITSTLEHFLYNSVFFNDRCT